MNSLFETNHLLSNNHCIIANELRGQMMREIRRFCGAIAAAAFCLMPVSGIAQTLWTTSYVSPSSCRSHSGAHGAENFSRSIQGHKWPHTPGGGIEFIDHTAKHLNAAAVGRADDRRFVERLVTASQGNAFTALDFEGPGGSSPSFVTAILVRNVSFAVSYLRGRNAISNAELQLVSGWVNKLIRNSKSRANSLDHKVAIITAEMTWAAATGDIKALNAAASRFVQFMGPLNRNPYFVADIRYNNEIMHHVSLAALVLRQNGFDALNRSYGSYTLNDAIMYHARQVYANKDTPIRTGSEPNEPPRSIFRSQGWGTHLAWIPVVLSTPGSEPARGDVRALDVLLRKSDRSPYWGIQIGVHSGCLFGRG
jgi:hypothetical protein